MDEPLKIDSVITEETGKDRQDGRGSGLYTVVLRLNRNATRGEGDRLAEMWDRPPQFTAMHRKGILDVSGYRLYLRGTTLEEVRDVHLNTLKLILPLLNAQTAELDAERAAKYAARRAEEESRRQHIADVASQIKFD